MLFAVCHRCFCQTGLLPCYWMCILKGQINQLYIYPWLFFTRYAASIDDILEEEEHYADQLKEYLFYAEALRYVQKSRAQKEAVVLFSNVMLMFNLVCYPLLFSDKGKFQYCGVSMFLFLILLTCI